MRDRPVWITLLGLTSALAALVGAASTRPSAVDVIALDAFATSAAEVARWQRAGYVVNCHLRAGVWEADRPDAARFDPALRGWPAGNGGRWLDLRRWDALRPILDDRIALCAAKGFEGISVSDVYGLNTGFALTQADRDAFVAGFVGLARGHALAITPAGVAGSADTSTTTGS